MNEADIRVVAYYETNIKRYSTATHTHRHRHNAHVSPFERLLSSNMKINYTGGFIVVAAFKLSLSHLKMRAPVTRFALLFANFEHFADHISVSFPFHCMASCFGWKLISVARCCSTVNTLFNLVASHTHTRPGRTQTFAIKSSMWMEAKYSLQICKQYNSIQNSVDRWTKSICFIYVPCTRSSFTQFIHLGFVWGSCNQSQWKVQWMPRHVLKPNRKMFPLIFLYVHS